MPKKTPEVEAVPVEKDEESNVVDLTTSNDEVTDLPKASPTKKAKNKVVKRRRRLRTKVIDNVDSANTKGAIRLNIGV